MTPFVLRPNATAVYRFLSILAFRLAEGETLEGKRILDCGAGGAVPPVALFRQQGMEAHGVDIDDDQLALSRRFCEEHAMSIDLRKADMRSLPYSEATFDYVYEHYTICHLSASDTADALAEMRRVLKPGGLLFVGVISADSWPLSVYDVRRGPGENGLPIDGGEEETHTVFDDQQADALVDGWEILGKGKAVRILREQATQTTRDEWRALYPEARAVGSEDEWMNR